MLSGGLCETPKASFAVGQGRDISGSFKPHLSPLDAVGNELEPRRLCCCSSVVFPSSLNTSLLLPNCGTVPALGGAALSRGDAVGIHLPLE